MSNPICLSPLKFYDDISKQNHRKSYAYEHVSPLILPVSFIPPFQFIVENWSTDYGYVFVNLIDANTGQKVADISSYIRDTGFAIIEHEGYKIAKYSANVDITDESELLSFKKEGRFYLEITSRSDDLAPKYYSEVFCFTSNLDDCIRIRYWNETGNFYLKNGVVVFPTGFNFLIWLKSEIGKPEYTFEEESTKRLGYNFIESQVSKKVYKFNTIVPEFICDAMRIIRLCDNKEIQYKGETYDAINFEMDVDWQTQGDLASVNCEFETDNIIVNLGGFIPNAQ